MQKMSRYLKNWANIFLKLYDYSKTKNCINIIQILNCKNKREDKISNYWKEYKILDLHKQIQKLNKYHSKNKFRGLSCFVKVMFEIKFHFMKLVLIQPNLNKEKYTFINYWVVVVEWSNRKLIQYSKIKITKLIWTFWN
jgi:hypothetical protein